MDLQLAKPTSFIHCSFSIESNLNCISDSSSPCYRRMAMGIWVTGSLRHRIVKGQLDFSESIWYGVDGHEEYG
jgi:hypothetical protein